MSGFVTVSPAKIEKTLTDILGGQAGERSSYSAGEVGNLVICSSGKWSDREIDECIEHLAVPHSCRFFIVMPGTVEFSTAVTSRCRKVDQNEHVCTDIVKVAFPLSDTARAISVLRSNFIPGVDSELLMFDENIDRELLKALFGIVDKALVDSSEYAKKFLFVKELLAMRDGLVDAAWLRLLPWREAIKDGTRLADWENLSEIRMAYQTAEPPVEPLLLLAWILMQLNLDVISCTASGYETRGRGIIPVRMGVESESAVTFVFKNTKSRIGCPALESSKVSLFARYYHHRPRMLEYPAIARLALDLELMRQSFGSNWR